MVTNVALSGQRFRYLKYKEGEEELYDLQNDPHEWRNLAGSEQHQDSHGETNDVDSRGKDP